jgi:anti-sigma B factor antagonist
LADDDVAQRTSQLRVETVESGPGVVRVTPAGDLDYATAAALRDRLTGILAEGGPTQLQLDLAGVTFVDSVGLSALIAAWRQARATGCDWVVLRPRESILATLRITGLAKMWEIRTDGSAGAAADVRSEPPGPVG